MTSEWRTIRAADFIDFNPRLSLKKGDIATKVAMDKLKPFTKKIPETEKAEFNGGAKFCNGDTVMARITPCLENGKTAYVDMLDDGEIGFGSTEFMAGRTCYAAAGTLPLPPKNHQLLQPEVLPRATDRYDEGS